MAPPTGPLDVLPILCVIREQKNLGFKNTNVNLPFRKCRKTRKPLTPRGFARALPMRFIWRSSILLLVGEQELAFQKLKGFFCFFCPWKPLSPERMCESTPNGVHLTVLHFISGEEQNGLQKLQLYRPVWNFETFFVRVGGDRKGPSISPNSSTIKSKLCWFKICSQELYTGLNEKLWST